MGIKNLAGKFITFEGIEGVGKTTILQFLVKYLKENHIDVVLTREPGGTKIGEEIRQILLSHSDEHMNGMVELLLFFAARKQHAEQVILPSLKLNKCVLCDRFTDSSYAYQGAGRGVAFQKIHTLEKITLDGLTPDLTFILDVPPAIGLERVKGRGGLDRIEKEETSFFTTVRNAFLKRAAESKDRYVVIDTTQDLNTVQNSVIAALNSKFI